MLSFIRNLIINLTRYSRGLNEIALLQNQIWINIDEIDHHRKLFIFRPENKLIISINGQVQRGKWEYINNYTILMEMNHEELLLHATFLDDEILILNQDNTGNYALFIKDNAQIKDLNTAESISYYLQKKYCEEPTDDDDDDDYDDEEDPFSP